jgi:serine protease Do
MTRVGYFIAVVFGLAVVPVVSAAADSGPRAKPVAAMASVVSVLPVTDRSNTNMDEPEGTAFAIDDGSLYVTADHVLGRATQVRIRLADATVAPAEILLRDPQTDLALLRSSTLLPPLKFSGHPYVGQDVCAVGNPFGLGIGLSCGIVSAVERRGVGFNRIEDFVQTDTAINPGMSGAPLLSMDGEVVGVVTAIFTKQSDGDLGVNFAASARLVSAVLADAADGRIDRPKPQLLLRPVPSPGQTGRAGGEVIRVTPGSGAEKAGIIAGDVIVAIGEMAVRSQADYLAAQVLFTGKEMKYHLLRAGAKMDVAVHEVEKMEKTDE